MQLQSPHLMLGNVLTCSMFYKGSAHRRCVCVMSICLVGLCLSSFHLYVFIACLYEPQIGRLLNLVELVTIKILFIKQHKQSDQQLLVYTVPATVGRVGPCSAAHRAISPLMYD